jgi:transposase InsO family protein
MLKVSYSGYYAYASGKSYLKSEQAEVLAAKVKEVYWIHKRRYGSRRISAELIATGIKAGRHRVSILMREQNLKAIQPRSFVPRTTV